MKVWLLLFAFAGLVIGQPLQGVIDIHAHAGPDSVPRSVDALTLVRLAKERGLRGIVLKNHYESTASLAFIARQAVPGIEVFGGIALNRAVGGINLAAVERFAAVQGGCGRIVWMPTFDAESQARKAGDARPFVPISRNGRLLPEVLTVLDLVAKRDLILATGHSSPAEVLMLIDEARKRGVKRILVTHPLNPVIGMSLAQMRQAAAAEAFLEFVGNAIYGVQKDTEPKDYAAAMGAVGFDHAILATDFGQPGNPLHPDGMEIIIRLLRDAGVPQDALERMTKTNPAKLLGLE